MVRLGRGREENGVFVGQDRGSEDGLTLTHTGFIILHWVSRNNMHNWGGAVVVYSDHWSSKHIYRATLNSMSLTWRPYINIWSPGIQGPPIYLQGTQKTGHGCRTAILPYWSPVPLSLQPAQAISVGLPQKKFWLGRYLISMLPVSWLWDPKDTLPELLRIFS